MRARKRDGVSTRGHFLTMHPDVQNRVCLTTAIWRSEFTVKSLFSAPALIIGSAEALPIIESAEALPILCVRYFWWERERERERYRERRKWRHHCRAKIGDEFTPSLAKNSHKWRRVYTFPCQKFPLFVSAFTLPVSPFLNGHHCGAEIRNEFTLPLPKNFSLLVRNLNRKLALVGKFLSPESLKWREPRDEWSKT